MTNVPPLPRSARLEVLRTMPAVALALAAGTVLPYVQSGSAPLVAQVGVVPLLVGLSALIATQLWALHSEVRG